MSEPTTIPCENTKAIDEHSEAIANLAASLSATLDVAKAHSDANLVAAKSYADTKASLVDGKVPANQLPSYVDDVLEYDAISAFPETGEAGRIYVAKDVNLVYRWDGAKYVEISPSLALGETASTAYPGDKGKTVADTLAEKADEFTEWVTTNLPAGVTVTSGPEWSALDGRWKMSTSDGFVWEGISGISGSEDAIFIQWYTEAPPYAPVSNRKRVLRTGDADKLTSEQKTMLDGGPYLPLSGGTMNDGATIKLNSMGASIGGGPTDGTVYIEARGSNSPGVFASGAINLRAKYVRKNNEELATEEQVNAKADKATTLAGYGITDGATKTELAALTAKVEYPLYDVPSTGLLKDRAINTASLATVTVPDNFTDLLIRASVASSLSVTMPEAITTKYGDTFPGEAGEYLITITKTGTAEAYVRTIKLEVANA